MDELIPKENARKENIGDRCRSENLSTQQVENIFYSGIVFDIIGALVHIGFHYSDFTFVAKWVGTMLNHSDSNVRAMSVYSMGCFCRCHDTILNPKLVISLLVKGIFDVDLSCSLDVNKDAKQLMLSARIAERNTWRWSLCTLKTKEILSRNLTHHLVRLQHRLFIWNKNKFFSWKWRRVFHRSKIDSKLLCKAKKHNGKACSYNMQLLKNQLEHVFWEEALIIITTGYAEDAVGKIIISSWYQDDYAQFLQIVKAGIKRAEAIVRYYAIRALFEHMIIFRNFYEMEDSFEILNEFILSEEGAQRPELPPIREKIVKAYPDSHTCPCPSPLEYYERMDLRAKAIEQIENMRDYIIYATVGYEEDEE